MAKRPFGTIGKGKGKEDADEAGKASPAGEKDAASRDADATQRVTPPVPVTPERHATSALDAPEGVTRTLPTAAAQDAQAEEDAEGMLAYQSLERHRKEKRRKRRVKIVVGVCAAAVVAALIIVPRVLTPEDSGSSAPATSEVTRGDLTSSVSVTGAAQPASSVYVTPEVGGIVQDVRVSEGDTVNKGDVLFSLKNDSLDKAVSDAQRQVSDAQAQVNTAQRGVDNANAAYQKALAEWNAAPDAETQSGLTDPDSLYGDVQTANDSLNSAKSTLDSANEALADAKAQAAKRTVVAPTSGSVVAVNAKNGAAYGDATAGSTTSDGTGQSSSQSSSGWAVQIADLSKMRVATQVNEVDVSGVKVGQTADVTFSAIPGLECKATVEKIATVATGSDSGSTGGDGSVVTYEVDLLIDQPDQRIKPGMTANATIETQSVKDVLMVPVAALQNYDEGSGDATVTVVTLDKDGNVKKSRDVDVKVGEKNSSDAAVTGLKEGQTVKLTDDDSGSGSGDADADASGGMTAD